MAAFVGYPKYLFLRQKRTRKGIYAVKAGVKSELLGIVGFFVCLVRRLSPRSWHAQLGFGQLLPSRCGLLKSHETSTIYRAIEHWNLVSRNNRQDANQDLCGSRRLPFDFLHQTPA